MKGEIQFWSTIITIKKVSRDNSKGFSTLVNTVHHIVPKKDSWCEISVMYAALQAMLFLQSWDKSVYHPIRVFWAEYNECIVLKF